MIAWAVVLIPSSAWSDQFLCVPDKMTGFTFDESKNDWTSTTFTTNFKYIIAPTNNGRDSYTLTKVGENEPEGYCKNGFNESGFLFCETFGGELKFNKSNGRYLMSFTYGYYIVGTDDTTKTDKDSGTPMIQIGKCSPF